jgi:hypothetical protein
MPNLCSVCGRVIDSGTICPECDHGEIETALKYFSGRWFPINAGESVSNGQILASALQSTRAELEIVKAEWDRLRIKNEKMRAALIPSAETKAAYIDEFHFDISDTDEDGDEIICQIYVPWTTIKEIMAAIYTRATLATPTEGMTREGK